MLRLVKYPELCKPAALREGAGHVWRCITRTHVYSWGTDARLKNGTYSKVTIALRGSHEDARGLVYLPTKG